MKDGKLTDLEREQIFVLAQDALYKDCDNEEVKKCLDYLYNKRHFSKDAIKDYSLGYIPLEVKHSLRGRLIMPLRDVYSNLVAITTRFFHDDNLKKNDLNNHWHESFDKRYYLYGHDIAKKSIIEKNYCILVEGQMDCMALYSAGIKNVVANLGGKLSIEHICLLTRYCDNLVLMFDDDASGNKDKEKAMSIHEEYECWKLNIKMHPVNLNKLKSIMPFIEAPDDICDPDEYLLYYGKDGILDLINNEMRI